MPSCSGANSPQPGVATPAVGAGERRLSNSSDCSTGSGNTRASSASVDQSGSCTEYLSATATRGRVSRAPPPRPAANPLQFVKVGPADLYRTAQEQLKKAELVKKSKEVTKVDQEDWQSNLDNWKCSRRKRVEHIIEKVVEVKRLTDEASVAAARRKAKTFNEMIEERAGRRRRCPLALYAEEEATDFSDLGIGTSSTKSSLSEDCDAHSLASDGVELEKNHSDIDNMSGGETERISRKFGSSANEYDTCTTATISSPEPEEYTYEGAIESYKSRVISKTKVAILDSHFNNNLSTISKDTNGNLPNGSSGKFSVRCVDKPLLFEARRTSDVDSAQIIKKDIPKIDILKRREMFEKESSPNENDNTKSLKNSVDINTSKSIKDRLSSLGKSTEEMTIKDVESKRLPSEVSSVRERLDLFKKGTSPENDVVKNLNSNGDIFNTRSLKERLSSLQTQAEDQMKVNKVTSREYIPSIKERLSSLDSYKSKNSPKSTPERDTFNAKLMNYNVEIETDQKYVNMDSSLETNNELKSQRQPFHHSMDNFGNNNAAGRNFDRIQSLEDINTNHIESTPLSPNDTDREDSGVHTADGSCAVSQADDNGEMNDLSSNLAMTEDSAQHKNELLQSCIIRDDQFINKAEVESVSSDLKSDPLTDQSLSESHSTLNSQIERSPSALEDNPEENEGLDKDDEETLKSIEQHDISVSLYDNSTSSVVSDGGDNVVFEGKMLIHVNLAEICSNFGAGSNNGTTNNTTNLKNNNEGEVIQSDSPLKSTFTVSDICTTPKKPLSVTVTPYHSSNTSLYGSLDNMKSPNASDYTPSLQRRLRSSLEEPNRRRTILHIKNRISPQPKESGPPIFDMPEILPPNLNSNNSCSHNSLKDS